MAAGRGAAERDLAALTDGSKGRLILRTPQAWSFRADPRDTGLVRGWGYTRATDWDTAPTDLYLQAQGLLHPDGQNYTGHWWYQTELELTPAQAAGNPHLMFPGLFNETWLYVNGQLVAHRPVREPWWRSDYRFEWDVNLSGHLRPGKNLMSLRGATIHHFGGMFRRPFLYERLQ